MKKKILIGILFLLLVSSLLYFLLFHHTSSNKGIFYLEDVYYKNDGLVDTDVSEIENLLKDKKSFVLFSYNNFCTMSIPCDTVFEEVAQKKGFVILQIPFTEFKESSLYKEVHYAPSVMIIEKGKLASFLDANKDIDLAKYQDADAFNDWISQYIIYK